MTSFQEDLAKTLKQTLENKDFSDRDLNGQRIKELFGLSVTFSPEENSTKSYDDYKRGDVVFVNNDAFDTVNGIQTKSRPAVIIQNNTGNKFSGNIIVCYLTGQIKKEDMPTHVVFKDSGCLKLCMAMGEQIQTIEKRYTKYIGQIGTKDLEALNKAIAISLGLDTYIEDQVNHLLRMCKKDLITYRDANVPIEELLGEEEVVVTEVIQEVTKEVTKEVVKEPIRLGTLLKVQSLEGKDFTYELGNKTISIENKQTNALFEFKAGDIESLEHFVNELEEFKEYCKSQK